MKMIKNDSENSFAFGGAYSKADDGLEVKKRIFKCLLASLIKYPALGILSLNRCCVYFFTRYVGCFNDEINSITLAIRRIDVRFIEE